MVKTAKMCLPNSKTIIEKRFETDDQLKKLFVNEELITKMENLFEMSVKF